MAGKRKAYSLVEAIIVVAIIGALAFIAVPRLNFTGLYKKQAHAVAKQITTDLRRARTMAIINAATNSTGYSLRMTGSSPYTGYQIVNDSNSAVIDTLTIVSPIDCSGGPNFLFGPLGNLRSGSNNSLTVTSEGKTYTITLISGTGIVECSGG
jgi:Tfp pilus assembly protein FimT